MIGALVSVGFSTYVRMVRPRHLAVAAAGGVAVGLLVRGLPSGEVAGEVFPVLLLLAAALLLLPLGASLSADDRRGGMAALVAVRPVASVSWGLGRCLGVVAGGAVLVLVIQLCARGVAGTAGVPASVAGTLVSSVVPRTAANDGHQWRFAVPAGATGPFDLVVGTLSLYGGASELTAEVMRGGRGARVTRTVRPQRRVVLSLPPVLAEDGGFARGDLYVALHAGPGLVLAAQPPRLVVGSAPLSSRPLDLGLLRRLVLALLAATAAASAFHFETACLAGLLALLVRTPPLPAWLAAVALLLAMSVAGTALVRRQALP